MRLLSLLLLLASLGPASRAAVPTPDARSFYVGTNGNNRWSGRLSQPNQDGTDGPFATVSRAIEASRNTPGNERRSIFLGAGTWFLPAALVLTPADQGLVIAALPEVRPVLSGGRPVGPWTETQIGGRSVLVADLPKDLQQTRFRELWVNGQRAIRARHPNSGYLALEGLLDKAADWTQGHSRFQFKPNDLEPWPGATNGEVIVMTRWVESRLPIRSIDPASRIAQFAKRSVFELAPGDLYYVEGVIETLDAPGEWCLDASAHRVYYLPRPGERPGNLQAVAPFLVQVLRIEASADRPLKNLHLHGLTFAHTEWYFPEGYASGNDAPEIEPAPDPNVGGFAQAAIGVPAAVVANGLQDSTFTRCSFLNLGTYALELKRACQGNTIRECVFRDLGAGGIKIGETRVRSNPAELTRRNTVADCRIYDGGNLFHSAIGIWIGQSPDNRLEHNLIHDFYYTGISVGWTWGYSDALATNTQVHLNHVHHIGVRSNGDGPILSDMAGIYTLGRQHGTIIRSNLWHDVAGLRYGGWGIYFDEGTSGILAEKNLVYRTTHGGFHQHYGATNLVRNNIFAFARDFQVQRSRAEPHLSFTFTNNIVFFDSGVLFSGNWSGDRFQVDHNVYFDTRKPGALPNLGVGTWEEWQARGHDGHSLIADPRFIAPRENDFRLQPESPAIQRAFEPFDLRTVGARVSQ